MLFVLRTTSFYPRHPRGWRRRMQWHRRHERSFYPRHPRGWRRKRCTRAARKSLFLSTPPSRVATAQFVGGLLVQLGFYPRHPRGWRRFVHYGKLCKRSFYPRHPRGWRLFLSQDCRAGLTVSIHATLAGGDSMTRQRLCRTAWFLSTPPSRVATLLTGGRGIIYFCFYPRHPRGWRRRP